MLLSTSRIEKNKNIYFYEQDILIDDHAYFGNIQVTIDVDYINPGIGIALVSSEGLSLKENGETYLFRIGYSEYSIIRRYGDRVEVIDNGPTIDTKPFKENMKVQIKKINGRAYFYVNDTLLTKKYLPSVLEKFMIGYYSSAGNIIKSISIASEVPDGWVVNMNNTNGGYAKFEANKFTITNCLDRAEIEQTKIKLKANTESNPYYYLNYIPEKVDDKNDIKVFVFESNDDRYVDEEKNILNKEGFFSLKKDTEVNLKFVGTIGAISNIQITNRKDDFYIGTDYEQTATQASLIKLKTKDIVKIEWSGTIFGTPEYDLNNPDMEKFGIVRDYDKIYYPNIYGIKVGEDCKYEYTLDLNNSGKDILTAKRNKETVTIEMNIVDTVTIFENMDAVIDKLILYKDDGTIINLIVENTKKQYVPSSIKSPIIVTSESGEPLDLSSSYRVLKDGDSIKYVFTNIEREVFEPINKIKLTNRASDKLDTITVYGIMKDSNIYPDKIMHTTKENIKDISQYADYFEVIHESVLYEINKETGAITITDKDDNYMNNRYREIVVDYLKKNSYAINYKHELGSYEVDISASENTKMYYDGAAFDNNGFSSVQEYKLLNATFKNNSYIVLREGEK